MAEIQHTIGFENARVTGNQIRLGFGIKINQNIAAENEIERPLERPFVQQVETVENDRVADRLRETECAVSRVANNEAVKVLINVFEFLGGIGAGLAVFQNGGVQIRCQDLFVFEVGQELRQNQRNAIWLLAG